MLFPLLLGAEFASLPLCVRQVHERMGVRRWSGRCTVRRGPGILIALLAKLSSLPPQADDIPVTVTIDATEGEETWTRNFNGHVMRSHLWAEHGLLAERLGAVTLRFRLQVIDGRIEWRVAGAQFLFVPLPASWFSGAIASEQRCDERYTFDVRAVLPLVGLLVHYRGWLAEA